MNKIIFLKNTVNGAWDPILKGYRSAFKNLGCEVKEVNSLKDIEPGCFLFLREWEIDRYAFSAMENSKKTFMFVQPQFYDMPWGGHPNFISNLDKNIRGKIAQMDNVYKWTFADLTDSNFKSYYSEWGKINSLPLAFDNLNYKNVVDKKYQYDVCFIGGWANNGFNEKKQIILKTFSPFMDSGLKCGFFINKGISHDIENKILSNSKVCLNIHDKYQRVFGRDTNERTFKSLGLNGLLVSDEIAQQNTLFPMVESNNNPNEVLKSVKKYVTMDEDLRKSIKDKNKNLILGQHTYSHRVKKMLNE